MNIWWFDVGTCNCSGGRVSVPALIHAFYPILYYVYRHHHQQVKYCHQDHERYLQGGFKIRKCHDQDIKVIYDASFPRGPTSKRKADALAGTHAPWSWLIYFQLYYSTDSSQASNARVRTHAVKRRTISKTGIAISPVNTMIPGEVMCSSQTFDTLQWQKEKPGSTVCVRFTSLHLHF